LPRRVVRCAVVHARIRPKWLLISVDRKLVPVWFEHFR
jgi:hypothetical protein